MIHPVGSVKALIGLSILSLALQTAGTSVPDITGIIAPVERVTLVGVLVLAVKVLWTSNKDKDTIILGIAKTTTETMVKVMESVAEFRRTMDENGAAMDNMAENVAALMAHNGLIAREERDDDPPSRKR